MRIHKQHIFFALVFMLCFFMAKYMYMEQTISDMAVLSLVLCFAFGFILFNVYPDGGLTMQRKKLTESMRSDVRRTNLVCLLIISAAAGFSLGYLITFGMANIIVMAVLLFFLGIRLSAAFFYF